MAVKTYKYIFLVLGSEDFSDSVTFLCPVSVGDRVVINEKNYLVVEMKFSSKAEENHTLVLRPC